MKPDKIFIQAPAKVNLALAAGPTDTVSTHARHPICTWMAGITLYDDLTVIPLREGHFSRYATIWADDAKHKTDINWSVTQDLAVRAHLKLERYVDKALAVQMKLEKRIPAGSGLGGGSSNAAAMLLACNQLFNLGLTGEELAEIADSIGSDIVFFLNNPENKLNCIVEGFGEKIEPIIAWDSANGLHLVIVMPGITNSTGTVYRKFDKLHTDRELLNSEFIRKSEVLRKISKAGFITQDEYFNDLEDAAMAMYPALIPVRAQIEEISERKVCLTGSGAAMFVFCDDSLHAQFLAKAITERYGLSSWDVTLHEQ